MKYFVKQMMRYDNGVLSDARVIIDGPGIANSGGTLVPPFERVTSRANKGRAL